MFTHSHNFRIISTRKSTYKFSKFRHFPLPKPVISTNLHLDSLFRRFRRARDLRTSTEVNAGLKHLISVSAIFLKTRRRNSFRNNEWGWGNVLMPVCFEVIRPNLCRCLCLGIDIRGCQPCANE